jgi:hypothetical protein
VYKKLSSIYNFTAEYCLIKVANDVDVQDEEDSIDFNSDEDYITSTFFTRKAETEVSYVFI